MKNTTNSSSTSTSASRNRNTMRNRSSATAQSGACGGSVRLTLPKGSYTIDGAGNLIIHGGATSSGEVGGTPSPLCPDLSYAEFMERADGQSASRRPEPGTGDSRDPFGMDFSAFSADPEKLVRECRGTVYGYARCSTLHQDYQRQVDALLKLGIRDEDIFKDKKSGKDFNREEFQKLMHLLRPGDCIVVVELDRFGRSMSEIKKQWFWITQQRQADIIVLDQPVLNTRLGVHGLGAFLADLVLAVFSLMAEIERKLINKRVEEGIRLARLAGMKLGRRLMEIPALFWKLKERFLGGQISQNMASRELGVDPKTFRSWVERTGDISDAQEWEALKAGIEEQEREERIRQARIDYGETAGPAGAAAVQETEPVREAVAVQEADSVRGADPVQEVAGQAMPAESGMADAGGSPGRALQGAENPMDSGQMGEAREKPDGTGRNPGARNFPERPGESQPLPETNAGKAVCQCRQERLSVPAKSSGIPEKSPEIRK